MNNQVPSDWTTSGLVPSADVQWPAISLYLGRGSAFGLRFIKLVKRAEETLLQWVSKEEAKRLISPLYGFPLEETLGSGPSAVFLSHEHFGFIRLVAPVEDFQVVAKSFHVKPLLSQDLERPSFFLVLCQKEELSLYAYRANQLQLRWRSDPKISFSEKLNGLREKLENVVPSERSMGKVLVWGKELQHGDQRIFFELNWDTVVQTSDPSIGELMSLCEEESRKLSQARRRGLVERFEQKRAIGHTCDSLPEIFRMIQNNQVEHLLVARDRQIWGQLDLKQERLKLQATQGVSQSDDLLDDISEFALNRGGKVSALPFTEMPTDGYVAAILRSK